jgi:zinc protease
VIRFRLFVPSVLAILGIGMLAGATPDDGASSSIEEPRVEQRRLDNGLTIIVQEDHRNPLVSLVLLSDAGERASPDGMHGLAWLTALVVADATKHMARGDAHRHLRRAGATFRDSSDADTHYQTVTLPSRRFALPLWIWSDRMGFFDEGFDEALLRTTRDQQIERLRAWQEGSPLGRLDGFADEELFPADHPYHAPYGTRESLSQIGRTDIIAFHDRWMTPDHATLVIVGDVKAAEAMAEVERWFGPIPASAERKWFPPPSLPRLAGETRVEIAAPVATARVSIRWPTPALLTIDDAQLDVVARLLAGKHRAFVYWDLVTTDKVATSVTARQASRRLASEFVVTIEGAPGKSASELLAAFDRSMDSFAARALQQGEIDHAAYDMVIANVYGYEAAPTRAFELAKYNALAGTPLYFGADAQRYDDITPAVVASVVKKWLPRDRRVVMLVTPDRSAAPGGERRGRRVVPAGTQL